ncbi:histidine kinase [Spirosoma sp. KCTC 42546]|uniref:histidine kinase n=1 Tax=Spirosoma sp. KCTC 42546 TaxID=2520506 RepID=UPI00143DC8AE|nr:histidine kinase [Spirosoma sp. KCTC 42546]
MRQLYTQMQTSASLASRSFYLPQRQDWAYWLVAFLIFYIDQVSIWGWKLNQGFGSALLNVGLGVLVAYPHLYWFDRFYGKHMGWYFAGLGFLGFVDSTLYWWIANIPIDSAPYVLLDITPTSSNDRAGLNESPIGWVGKYLGEVGQSVARNRPSDNHTIWIRNFPEAIIIMWSLTVVHRRKTLADVRHELEHQNQQLDLQNHQLELTIAHNRLLYDNFMRRMEPHFLFNIIDSLHTRARGNPDLQETIVQIRDFMSYVIKNSREQEFMEGVPLLDEVDFLNKLISFRDEKAKRQGLQPLITFDFRANMSNPVRVPPMIFAEFVDNSFKYGVEKYGRDYLASLLQTVPLPVPYVKIELFIETTHTYFSVQNNVSESAESVAVSTGEGLPNIRERLRLFYGARFRDDDLLVKTENGHFYVALHLNN